MYRYTKCGFKMSNITCHTGLLTGTGTPSVQLGYSVVLCMSNILGMNDIGPSMICKENGTQIQAEDVKSAISNPTRKKGYKKFPFHLRNMCAVNQIDFHTHGSDPMTAQTYYQLPNMCDRMYTKIGSFPQTSWATKIPPRWRNSLGSLTCGSTLTDGQDEFNLPNTYLTFAPFPTLLQSILGLLTSSINSFIILTYS